MLVPASGVLCAAASATGVEASPAATLPSTPVAGDAPLSRPSSSPQPSTSASASVLVFTRTMKVAIDLPSPLRFARC
jgi:hypothetical protein